MIVKVLVPDVGGGGSGVRLVEWLVREGESVSPGQPLFVLESDKGIQDIEAFQGGYLRRILHANGSQLQIGDVVAILADSADEPLGTTSEPAAPALPKPAIASCESPRTIATTTGRVPASPAARRLAGERSIDLSRLTGSGPEGQIQLRDVEQALAASADTIAPLAKGRRVPLTGMRRSIAQKTQLSKATIPHFYASVAVDMTDALAWLDAQKGCTLSEGQARLTINDLVLHAAAHSLRAHPALNASFQGETIVYFDDVDIGMAVGLEDGVVVPVIRQADQIELWTLAFETERVRRAAVARQLSEAEMSGGALTVSNLGMHGLDSFVAVINPPQAAALAVGAARLQPAVVAGQLAVRTLMQLTLSVDHRLADGVLAAHFLSDVRRRLEQGLEDKRLLPPGEGVRRPDEGR